MDEQNELNSAENNVDTTATSTDDTGEEEQVSNGEQQVVESDEKVFTKEEVRKIMQKRINRSHKSFYDRYGVENLEALDKKFALIDQLTQEKEALANEKTELLNKLAFVENDINPERIEDIKAYFKGKDIMFNDENLKTELATHPEWKNIKVVDNTPMTTIKEMSPTRSEKYDEDESEAVAKMFGLKKIYNFGGN